MLQDHGYADILDKDGFPLTPDAYLNAAYSESGELSLEKARDLATRYQTIAQNSWHEVMSYFTHYDPYMLQGGVSALFMLNQIPNIATSMKNLSTRDHDTELCLCLLETFLSQAPPRKLPTLKIVYDINFHLKLLVRNVHIHSMVGFMERLSKSEHKDTDLRMLILSAYSTLQRRGDIPVTTRTLARQKAVDYASLFDFHNPLGISGNDVVTLLSTAGDTIENRFNDWMQTSWSDRSWDVELPDDLTRCFQLAPGELLAMNQGFKSEARVEAVMKLLCHDIQSIRFDGIAQSLMDREVRKRPFMLMPDGNYLCSCIDSLLLDPKLLVTELAKSSGVLTDKTHRKIAMHLEQGVVALFREALPSAELFPNVKWRHSSNNKVYEVDLLVAMAGHLLVIEAKSGRVADPAHQGKLLSLKTTVGKLVDYASEQTLRFIDDLTGLTPIKGMTPAQLDQFRTTPEEQRLPLVITHEQLGVMGANFTPDSSDTARPLSLDELQLMMELLHSEAERLFYLVWRRQYAAFFGNETRLLGLYLNVAFAEQESADKTSEKSYLTQYHLYKTGQVPQPPSRPFTPRWKAILAAFARHGFEDWLKVSFNILGFNYTQQLEFEKQLDTMRTEVAQQMGHMKAPAIFKVSYGHSLGRKVALCPGICVNTNAENRNHAMQQCAENVLAKSDADEVLVFAIQDEYQDPDFTGFCYVSR